MNVSVNALTKKPVTQLTGEEKSYLLRAFATNMIDFGRYISLDEPDLPSPEFHYEISDLFINSGKRYIALEAGRGYAKSTIIACWAVLHYIVYNPGKKYIVLMSKSKTEAQKRLSTIKTILEHSETFKQMYGYRGRMVCSRWNQNYVIYGDMRKNFRDSDEERDVFILEAKGVEEQTRGLQQDLIRPTLFIVDDIEDAGNTKTQLSLDNNYDTFKTTLAGLDTKKGRCWAIGTPIAYKCTIERLFDRSDFESRRYPIANFEDKTTLWEAKYTFQEVLQLQKQSIEDGDPDFFWREYMCVVKGTSNQKFTDRDMMYYNGRVTLNEVGEGLLHMTEPRLEIIPVNLFIGIDPAPTANAYSDDSVIMPIAMDRERNIYVLDHFFGKVEPEELGRTFLDFFHRLRPRWVTLETTAAQVVFITVIDLLTRKNINGKESREYIPGLKAKNNPRDSKSKRYQEQLQPYHKQHKIFIKAEHEQLKFEMLMFGATGIKDDLIDGLYWAIHKAYPPSHIYSKSDTKITVKKKKSKTTWMSAI